MHAVSPEHGFAAAMEVMAAVGLIAPWLSGTARILTPLAAVNTLLFALAVFVLLGRLLGWAGAL